MLMKEIVLDTETTGLSVENGHRIVEIGCIELENQILTSNRFHCYLNPQRKVSDEALKELIEGVEHPQNKKLNTCVAAENCQTRRPERFMGRLKRS